MKSDLTLSFYSNIPTPYQDDFFNELENKCNFRAVFYAVSEKDRSWTPSEVNYSRKFLVPSFFSRIIQRKFKDYHFSWDIFKLCFKEESDWIILGGNYFALNNLIASRILKWRNKKLGFFSEQLKNDASLWNQLKKLYLKVFLSRIDLLVCVGQCSIESYNRLGFSNKRKILIPYNIAIDRFNKAKLDSSKIMKLRNDLNLGEKIVFLSSGALVKRKGMDLVIQAFNSLNDQLKEKASLIILGEGMERSSLLNLIRTNNIHLLGFKQKAEIPYYFALADIFIFCSRYDGWGLVINEAIASELAIICSDAVGASECIVQSKNGIIVPNENLQIYAEAINLLIESQSTLDEMKTENAKRKFFISSSINAEKLVHALNAN